MSARKKYTPEYRQEAARLVIDTGRPIAEVARELNLGATLLGRWVKKERERTGELGDGAPAELDTNERGELDRLRRENAELKMDNEFLGKGCLLRVEASKVECFQLMRQEKANYSISRMARLLKVSRSGYYKWADQQDKKDKGLDPKEIWRRELDEKILKFWNASDQTYGSPRITIDLRDEGIYVDRKTVAKAMRRLGIEGISPRSWVPVTTIPGKPTHSIPDRVKRLFDTGELNRVWMSDITYLRTGEGWLYLCAVRDGCSRRVLGWAMDPTQTTDLVEKALRMTHTLRGEVPEGLVFHADRGTQFTSDQLYQVCQELGIDQSMGRTGVCFDNAMAESFWSTLKTEFYDRRTWKTRNEARREVARWIEIFYNRRRRHSSIGNQPPVDFENAYHQAATAADENAA